MGDQKAWGGEHKVGAEVPEGYLETVQLSLCTLGLG